MPQLAFVPGDEFGRTRAKAQKLIRSHCMLGKNKHKSKSRTSRTKKSAPETDAQTRRPQKSNLWPVAAPSPSLPLAWKSRIDGFSIDATTTRGTYRPDRHYALPALERSPSTFSLLSFARKIDNSSHELIFKYKLLPPIQSFVFRDSRNVLHGGLHFNKPDSVRHRAS
jgi:hypothetical protein